MENLATIFIHRHLYEPWIKWHSINHFWTIEWNYWFYNIFVGFWNKQILCCKAHYKRSKCILHFDWKNHWTLELKIYFLVEANNNPIQILYRNWKSLMFQQIELMRKPFYQWIFWWIICSFFTGIEVWLQFSICGWSDQE